MVHSSKKGRPRAHDVAPELAHQLRRQLEAAGLRYTRQRGVVYDALARVDTHPTAEEVYRTVRTQMPRISLGTVYTALEALVRAGLANRLTYGDGSARYDCRREEHYHLRDTSTGEVRDLPTEFDPKLLEKLDPRLVEMLAKQGFQVTGYRLEVLGRFE